MWLTSNMKNQVLSSGYDGFSHMSPNCFALRTSVRYSPCTRVSQERLVTYGQLQLPVWHRSWDTGRGNFCRRTAQIRLAVVMYEGHFLNCEQTQEGPATVDSAISREVGRTEKGSRVWGSGTISPHPDLDNPSLRLFPSDPRLCHADNSYTYSGLIKQKPLFCFSSESQQKVATEAWRSMCWLPFLYFKLLLFRNTKGVYHLKYSK